MEELKFNPYKTKHPLSPLGPGKVLRNREMFSMIFTPS
uniref:Uncharacterized protein n=1 Tax=Zea mays TaxID=4577 RepID=C4IYB4_MAIZE|nr:unknown [Zea mays]